jgi:xylulokinase
VAGGGGDNAAAAIGTGVCKSGTAFTTIGTSGVVCAHTDLPTIDKQGRVHTFCCAVPGQWHLMGVTQAAGLSLNWFRNNFAKDISYRELDALAEQVAIGAERLVYLPYLMGERTPVLDSDARGTFVGLSAMHGVAELGRAVIEGVSYSLCNCMDVLREMGVDMTDMAVCGGGAKSPLWRQMLADVYAVPVKTLESSEGAALGAAILGGCAAGVYSSVEEGCARAVRPKETTAVNAENHEKYMKVYEVYNGLYRALKPSFDQLKTLGE